MKQHIYSVQGSGHFPYDMLRYDRCFPSQQVDIAALDRKGSRIIQMRSQYPPTEGRWKSFGWTVVTHREEK